jgi:hypothetical protein
VLQAAKVIYGGFDNWRVKGIRDLQIGTPEGGLTVEVVILNTDTREVLRIEGVWDGEEWSGKILATELDSDRADAAKKGKGKGRAKPKCTKGQPCGGSCISRAKNCRIKPDGPVKDALTRAAKAATPKAPGQGAGGGGAGGGAANTTPKRVKEFEDSIVNLSFERAGAFKNGRKVLERDGTKSQIQFQPRDANKLLGAILVHNHPLGEGYAKGGGFSPADIQTAIAFQLKETRVVSGDSVYSMKTNDVKWSPKLNQDIEKIEQATWKKYEKAMQAKMDDPNTSYTEGMRYMDNAMFDYTHEFSQKVAEKYGFIYTRDAR